MSDCIFCDIASGQATASIVYRDDRVTSFLDHHPVTPGHLMVIPNEHFTLLNAIPDDLASHIFRVASRLGAALRRSGLPCDGVNLFLADGEAAGQEVLHMHLHVFPRVAGDGFTIDAIAWADARPTRGTLDANAAAIRRALAAGI